jgi:trehalose 6-phosphate phosphatase
VMKSILQAPGRDLLADFTRGRVLVGFDYDGTLAPIVTRHRSADMRRSTRALLSEVARTYPTVVISGRCYDDIARRLRGIPLRYVFGNHGIEPLWITPGGAALVHRWAVQLEARLSAWQGVEIENKTHSLAIHYRGAADHRRATQAIAAAISDLKGARAIPGTAAVNLVPIRGAHKGIALQRACGLARCARAIYVGDDGTDEDAFSAQGRSRVLGIRVGTRRGSAARFALPNQRQIDAFLSALVTLRTPPEPPRSRAPRS